MFVMVVMILVDLAHGSAFRDWFTGYIEVAAFTANGAVNDAVSSWRVENAGRVTRPTLPSFYLCTYLPTYRAQQLHLESTR
jgi:hypothetical protein